MSRTPEHPNVGKDRAANAPHRLIYAAFLLSGFAALMHEVVWAKLLAGLIGATAYSQAVVLAVFMGGLTLGSVLFGHRADHRGQPLRTYVRLELGIGTYCLAVPLLLHGAGLIYVAFASQWFESTGLLLLLRFVLATLVVLLPAVLMGGTLPILARHLVQRLDETQSRVADLYALNSFGAVLGAGTAGFLTLPLLGLYESLVAACLLNLTAAAIVVPAARREPSAPPRAGATGGGAPVSAVRRSRPRRPWTLQVPLVALALSGFAALGYEVLFTRVIALSFGSSTYSFTVMLMCFTAGIGVGSAVVARIEEENPLWLLGLCQLAVVVALILVTPLVARLPYLIGLLRIDLRSAAWGFELYQAGKASLILAVLLLPTICLGASFPLVARVQARRVDLLGSEIGSTYACNTTGNVLGAVLTTLVLLPGLGLLGAFHFNLALNLIAGIAFLVFARQVRAGDRVAAALVSLVVVAVYLISGTSWSDPVNLAVDHLRLTAPSPSLSPAALALYPTRSFENWRRTYMVRPDTTTRFFFEEDAHATVLAYERGNGAVLAVDGKPDASTQGDLPTQILLAHLPLFANLEARSLLVVGYGSGITVGSALRHPVKRADVVEISDGVIDADPIFARYNYHALDDPRVHIYHDDGRSFLRAAPRRYDVIISEPTNPWIAGVADLFTVGYFQSVREQLNPGGAAAIWFHQYEQSDASVNLVLRTLRSVFPYVEVFGLPDASDIIAVATVDRWVPRFGAMEQRFEQPAVRTDLERIGITTLAGLFSFQAVSTERLPGLIPPGSLNTVEHPLLEYAAPRSLFRDETATFLERADATSGGWNPADDTLLGRYIAYRRQKGRPLLPADLPEARQSRRSTPRSRTGEQHRSAGSRR